MAHLLEQKEIGRAAGTGGMAIPCGTTLEVGPTKGLGVPERTPVIPLSSWQFASSPTCDDEPVPPQRQMQHPRLRTGPPALLKPTPP